VTLLPSTLAAPTAVYRYYDARGDLLYVGVAIDPDIRAACHAREKAWWLEVDPSRTRIEWFPDRHAAISEENRALETENPIHNVSGTTKLPVPQSMREPRSYDNIRRLRVTQDLWDCYAEVVGNGGASTDLKAYIDWRLDNPTTPLPGKRRGPVKKTRTTRAPVMPKPGRQPETDD
jgi:hypothetical protein